MFKKFGFLMIHQKTRFYNPQKQGFGKNIFEYVGICFIAALIYF